MCQVALEIPNEVLYDTKMSKQDAENLQKKQLRCATMCRMEFHLGIVQRSQV